MKLLTGLIIIVLLNFISSFVFTRFDLTSEKRFTLSPATIDLVQKLDDVVYVKVYLEGDFPAGYKRLRNATREILDELRAYSGNNIEYEFINPSENADAEMRNKLYRQLAEKGLQPSNLPQKGKGEISQKIIFPGALLSYKNVELPLQLLKTQIGTPPEVMLNNSVEGLEYDFAKTIRDLTSKVKPKIGFIEGHGELEEIEVGDITRSLIESYDVQRIRIDGQLKALDGLKTIIIARPVSAFSEQDKFIIDQFIMKGGNVLWVVDGILASMDSLQRNPNTIAISNTSNLEDQLFRYGVRINPNVLVDIQSAPIPVVSGYNGDQPIQRLLPWYFFPLATSKSNHPVVNNLNAVKFEFASSIDTVSAKGVRKTILLSSSIYTREIYSPARISLDIIKQEPDINQFNKPERALAVLLEGEFKSVFKNRIPPLIAENKEIGFMEKSTLSRMIIIADGDVIKNVVRRSTGQILPLGYDKYTNQMFGNKNFLLNAIDFLSDESGLITVRAKELKIRLLDRARVEREKTKWQIINTMLPVLMVVIFGIVQHYLRKRKYARVEK